MKTAPMEHQLIGLQRLQGAPKYFALGAEQGTGKTWMLLADAEEQFERGRINAVLVVAPKGVHSNWIRREIPKHLSTPVEADYYLSGLGQRHKARLERMLRDDDEHVLKVLAINVDALNTKPGYQMAERFLETFEAMMIVDESQRIKNPKASRTKRVTKLGQLAVCRRIASGTIIANGPLDAFSQYTFLKPGLLGTKSFRAFVAEFAELFPADHKLVQHANRGARGTPQIIKKDALGRPRWRNLDKLQTMMAPHTFRVTKAECLDLPPKVYQERDFALPPDQQRIYDQVRDEMRWERDNGRVDTFSALTMIGKLRQLTSGFIMLDGEPTTLHANNQRMAALGEAVEDIDGQFIVWATYREEIRLISQMLAPLGVVEYHGGIESESAREAAVDVFQAGDARVFIGNPAAGGVGLTLTAASTVIYHSCDFSLEDRSQSEDRSHRIGTHDPVLYIDLVARGTIDEQIADALQSKRGVAEQILAGI